MVDYRRMGNMEQRSGNITSATLLHQLRDLWKRPRGTVVHIEALALVAITLSFFLSAFGSCRRWSNRWILQKGFFVANGLFLSLGTYGIGLMQSSSVKSEMYPFWAVSLFSLLSCVDSVTAYSLDYKSQLWKMMYQLCLYCGYVLLMSISTISSDVGNIAIGVLSAITFIKGFHRTLALMLPGRMRHIIRAVPDCWEQRIGEESAKFVTQGILVVDLSLNNVELRSIPEQEEPLDSDDEVTILPTDVKWDPRDVTLLQMNTRPKDDVLGSDVDACTDVCLAFSLSHLLQRRFLGFNRVLEIRTRDNSLVSSWILLKRDDGVIDYERAFKVVELELAFLYDVLFTSNAFLYYYEAKTASFWAVASVIGVCIVGVAVFIPGMRTSHMSGSTIVVDSRLEDLIITGAVMMLLALLQVLQLLHCWTSDWARVSFSCDCVRNKRKGIQRRISWQMRLRAYLIKITWFHRYLWQNRLGQHSLVESVSMSEYEPYRRFKGWLSKAYSPLSGKFGLLYFEQMLHELWGSNTGGAIELHADVKASIAGFIREIKSDAVGDLPSPLLAPRRLTTGMSRLVHPETTDWATADLSDRLGYYRTDWTAANYKYIVLMWHIATCYCELALRREKGSSKEQCIGDNDTVEKNHRVATALSKYCAYLVVSVPRLLPGQHMDTKYVYEAVAEKAGQVLRGVGDKLSAMERAIDTELLWRVKAQLEQVAIYRENQLDRKLREAMKQLGGVVERESQGDILRVAKGKLVGLDDKHWEMHWLHRAEDELCVIERMEREAWLGTAGMEKDRELLLQVKDELDAVEREMERESQASQVAQREGLSKETLMEKLAALEREMESTTGILCGAIDKLGEIDRDRKKRGIHRYMEDAGIGETVFWSGLDPGDRLRRQAVPERWKTLADFWLKALVYAAASDNVEEHMQHLSQGGQFITHLWALLYHHGILRWRHKEHVFPGFPEAEGSRSTRIHTGEECQSSSRATDAAARGEDASC